MIHPEAAQVETTPKSEDRKQQLIYDPAVGVTLAWTPADDAADTPTQEDAEARARRLALLASSGAWVYLSDTPE